MVRSAGDPARVQSTTATTLLHSPIVLEHDTEIEVRTAPKRPPSLLGSLAWRAGEVFPSSEILLPSSPVLVRRKTSKPPASGPGPGCSEPIDEPSRVHLAMFSAAACVERVFNDMTKRESACQACAHSLWDITYHTAHGTRHAARSMQHPLSAFPPSLQLPRSRSIPYKYPLSTVRSRPAEPKPKSSLSFKERASAR